MTYPDMSQYDKGYQDAADQPKFRDVPPGTYQAYVERAYIDVPDKVDENGDPKAPRFKLQMRITSGEYSGSCLFPSASFDYPEIVKGMVARMELDPVPQTASEVASEETLADMLDRVLEIKVAKNPKNPDFPKLYLQRFVKMLPAHGEGTDEPPPVGDDDIPF